jgi:hypothetical protein
MVLLRLLSVLSGNAVGCGRFAPSDFYAHIVNRFFVVGLGDGSIALDVCVPFLPFGRISVRCFE